MPVYTLFTNEQFARMVRQRATTRAACPPVSRSHQFLIRDPKERATTAPRLPVRVLHHAVVNVCEPHLERWLVPDSYACRRGEGRLAALNRARQYAGRFGWFLNLDVRRYFDTVPHDRLFDRLARPFNDRRLLDLLGRLVGSFRGNLEVGLPTGGLTPWGLTAYSPGRFDLDFKERPRSAGCLRHMQDLAVTPRSQSDRRRPFPA